MKNNIFGSNNSNNSSNNSRGKKPKFSILWMYVIIMAVILGIYWSNDMSTSRDVSWTQFQGYVEEGAVDSIVVFSNKQEANAYINDSLAKVIFKDRLPASQHARPYITTHIPSSEKFDDNVKEWNANGSFKGDVRYETASDISSWIWGFGPIILLIIFWFWMTRRMAGGGSGGGIFSVGKSKAKLFDKNDKTKVTFADVAGLAEAKTEVAEIVDFLKNPQRYTNLGGKIPKGALLVGPPGTGKTLLAKAVAGEADVPFFSLSGSDFVEMFVGVGASRVRDLFKQAKDKAPCIIFIDEIDAVGRARGKNPSMGGNDERESTLNQLLTEMDGFGTNNGVIVMAATNRADILDKALLRAGRFDRQIYVELPDIEERKAIFEVHMKGLKLGNDIDKDFLSKQTPGFSGADIANVCNEAALVAARKDKALIEKQDFLDAIDRIIGGLEKRSKVITTEEKRTIAYHESGHASVSWQLRWGQPLVKVTIVPRGKALGAAWYLPEERQITTYEQMFDEITSLVAGRAAEEVVFGQISTGALNDLERATKMAFSLVAYYGMSPKIGNISYYDSTGQSEWNFTKPFSEQTNETIDNEVKRLVEEAYARAKQIILDSRDQLDQLAQVLFEREVIFREDVEKIYGARPWDDAKETAKDNTQTDSKADSDAKADSAEANTTIDAPAPTDNADEAAAEGPAAQPQQE